ncbi:MAG TPA: DUF4331 domain-containing protein [Actinomycetota bacterium]|nr:DUF4331 domain-containing protein [Actinomycetota bacterium]
MRFTRLAVAVGSALFLGAGVISGFAPGASLASSHREAPLTAADPAVDATDLYAFTSPDNKGTVTLISDWIPFQEPSGGPNFFAWEPGVQYDFRVDNQGNALAKVIYRVVFTSHYRNPSTFLYNTGQVTTLSDTDLNFYQTYNLDKIVTGASGAPLSDTRLVTGAIAVPSDVGDASMPNYPSLYHDGIYGLTDHGAGQVWVGQSDDPFFLDLRVFDLLYGTNFGEAGVDTLHGFNVSAIALQVPKAAVAQRNKPNQNPVIGVWSTAYRQSTRVQTSQGTQSFSGTYVGVSRLGNPLVNEVVIPVGMKDRFNASVPANDGQFLSLVQDPELPHLINAIYGVPIPDSDPNTPGIQRADLIAVFLTGVSGLNTQSMNADGPPSVTPGEELRLNMAITPCQPNTCSSYSPLGVIGGDNAGYPNGRRLADDVIDIALQVVEGELIGQPNDLSDGVNTNDAPFLDSFPYLPYPWSGSDPHPHG